MDFRFCVLTSVLRVVVVAAAGGRPRARGRRTDVSETSDRRCRNVGPTCPKRRTDVSDVTARRAGHDAILGVLRQRGEEARTCAKRTRAHTWISIPNDACANGARAAWTIAKAPCDTISCGRSSPKRYAIRCECCLACPGGRGRNAQIKSPVTRTGKEVASVRPSPTARRGSSCGILQHNHAKDHHRSKIFAAPESRINFWFSCCTPRRRRTATRDRGTRCSPWICRRAPSTAAPGGGGRHRA